MGEHSDMGMEVHGLECIQELSPVGVCTQLPLIAGRSKEAVCCKFRIASLFSRNIMSSTSSGVPAPLQRVHSEQSSDLMKNVIRHGHSGA